MRILVTNDDGIFAPGVEALVEVLQHFGEVYVVCPDQERSAVGHSITLRTPLKVKPVEIFSGTKGAWAVNGTPADCVKLGMEVLLKTPPDIFFQAEDGIRDDLVTGVQTCALPIFGRCG